MRRRGFASRAATSRTISPRQYATFVQPNGFTRMVCRAHLWFEHVCSVRLAPPLDAHSRDAAAAPGVDEEERDAAGALEPDAAR